MVNKKLKKRPDWVTIPPWIILGAVIILVPIFVFWTFQNINKQKEAMVRRLTEKGAALIRSFEAGTRTGMMGMMGMRAGGFQLQRLLMETAQQPDIVHLIVTDTQGNILAHSDHTKMGGVYGHDLDLERISRSEKMTWRQVTNWDEVDTFEVFRRFSPTQIPFRGPRGTTMHRRWRQNFANPPELSPDRGRVIFVGFDLRPMEAARKADTRHTIIMAFVLLLIGFAGIVSLFLAQAYRSTRTSLTRIKAFSDNVVQNMPVGLMAIDADGQVASFNQAAANTLRQAPREIVGKPAGDVLPRQIINLTFELEKGRRAIEREIDCSLGGGKVIPMDVSLSSLEGEEGTFLGYIILFRDLTEVQELKREIETSRRLASLGRLAAGIAHEIRNPLSSIKGFATYFRERYRENAEDKNTADIMIQEVDRLNRVIGQLLEFARPMALEKNPTSLQTLIRHALKMIEAQAKDKEITIQADLPLDVQEVPVDPDKLNQVLLNLYLNAIEATHKGGILAVSLSEESDANRVKISVSDTGVGISKEDLEHIFDPYFTTRQSGTGLGLAIVHRIIESHNGEMRVQSEPGRGTTVSVYLPASGA